MTISREDILINRAVDREASPADWSELDDLARRDPALWRRLAEAQRDHAALAAGVAEIAERADAVELPHHTIDATRVFHARWRVWSGWAVAAMLALVWATTRGLLPAATNPAGQTAGVTLANLTPDEAFNQYMTRGLEQGRVLAELPTLMIDSRPSEDGDALEITVMRRIIERKRVTGAFRVGVDEQGRLQLLPTSADAPGGST